MINKLEWESEFFKKEIYLKTVGDPVEYINHDALYLAKVDAKDYTSIDSLISETYQYVEGEITFKKGTLIEEVDNTQQPEIRVALEEDIENLQGLACGLYRNSRFREPWFSSSDNTRFYNEWIKNSVLGKFDDKCFIVEVSGQILGYVTVKKVSNSEARIGLIGVCSSARNLGVGGKLLKYIEYWCRAEKIENIFVSTQTSNLKALSMYVNNGYKINNSSVWLYRAG